MFNDPSMNVLAKKITNYVKICDQGPWMLPEITPIPTGQESGQVLVIGVGGSTLRLTDVTISKGESFSEELLNLVIHDEIKSGNIFSWCADHVVPLLDKWTSVHPEIVPIIAVSWSFPLLNGRILSMGKAFSSEFIGNDLLEMFNAVFPQNYTVKSVTHDGTSSLVAGIYESPRCKMALTLGTGVNINFVSKTFGIVNTEISMLGRHDTTPSINLEQEKWDITGSTVEFQPFEAQVGGLYLGQMASKALGQTVSTLDIWQILKSQDDTRYEIVNRIVNRAASMVSAAIYGLLNEQVSNTSLEEVVDVVYTGGVAFEPEFKTRLRAYLNSLAIKFGFSVCLKPQKHGSEIGAAIAALDSIKHKNTQQEY